jgi:Tol biopolymer transport system component
MNADGSEPRKLINVKECRWHGWPQWSHDGNQIAFEAQGNDAKGADTKLYKVAADGGLPIELGLGKSPSWSADDKQIVFSVPRGNSSDTKNGLWIMNADGTGRQWIAAGGRASCSPDGGRIALVNSADGNDAIYIYDLLTSDTTKILQQEYLHIFGCAWSPDAKQICFVGNRRNNPPELVIMDADGAEKSLKVRLSDNVGRDPNWAPSNKILLPLLIDNVLRLNSIDPTADRPPILLDRQATKQPNIDASWSPDGKRIVYSYNPIAN